MSVRRRCRLGRSRRDRSLVVSDGRASHASGQHQDGCDDDGTHRGTTRADESHVTDSTLCRTLCHEVGRARRLITRGSWAGCSDRRSGQESAFGSLEDFVTIRFDHYGPLMVDTSSSTPPRVRAARCGVATARPERPRRRKKRSSLSSFPHSRWRPRAHGQHSSPESSRGGGMPESPGLARRTEVLIDDATEGFVGRTYVFGRIESFLAENRSGYFRLIADPGEGKTAIMAEYVRRTGCVAHFNVLSETFNRTSQFTRTSPTIGRGLIADTGAGRGRSWVATARSRDAARGWRSPALVVDAAAGSRTCRCGSVPCSSRWIWPTSPMPRWAMFGTW